MKTDADETDLDASVDPVRIDSTKLDVEWVAQPETFYEAATELATARYRVAQSKARLDVVEATVSRRIRKSPDKYDLGANPSIPSVQAAMIVSKEYAEALDHLNKAKYRQDMIQALVDALDHKKKALESLAYLHGQNYYSTPKLRDAAPAAPEPTRSKERKRRPE